MTYTWSMSILKHVFFSLGHDWTFICLTYFYFCIISAFKKYNLLLSNRSTPKPASITFFVLPLCHNIHQIYLLMVCGATIMSPVHMKPFSKVYLHLLSWKGLSAIEQLLHIFLFCFYGILLNTASSLVSVLNQFRCKTSVSTRYSILFSGFSWFSNFSSSNSRLEMVTTCRSVFLFTYILSNQLL